MIAPLIGVAAAFALPAQAFERAKLDRRATAQQSVTFDLYLPLQHAADLDQLLTAQTEPSSPSYHQWLTPAAFDARFGPDAASRDAVLAELTAQGLTARAVSSRRIHVTGPAAAVERALGTTLAEAHFNSGRPAFTAMAPMRLSPTLRGAGAHVANLSGVVRAHRNAVRLQTDNRVSTTGAYWFDDLKQAYDFPSYQVYSGRGVTIGILMSGGYNPPDMDLYFAHEKLKTPAISEVPVGGGAPYDPVTSDETHLDIQQAGGMAPNASIMLYNIADLSDSSILAGLTQILADNRADIVSMSFGAAELAYTAPYNNGVDYSGLLSAYHDLFRQGNAQGVTFIASSGDLGGRDIPSAACFLAGATRNCGKFLVSVESPASDPNVTGVGGTNLVTTHDATNPADLSSVYLRESAYAEALTRDIFDGTPAVTSGVWGSGGGKSIFFARPAYQAHVNTYTSARAVPDVAMQMGGCPGGVISCGADDSAVYTVIGGRVTRLIGTSAAAPAFAGLLALKIERLGGARLGNENIDIYNLSVAQGQGRATVFHNRIIGNNGEYNTHPGYNQVLGNGTVMGRAFLMAPNIAAAGNPQSPSNP